jgi:predicted dinucleotide-binding enzyme
MKIGIIGSGDVGQALGRGLAAIGHTVMIGSRTPDSEALSSWKAGVGKRASTGSPADAAKYGDLIVVAVNWVGVEGALHDVRPEVAGKIVIDVTNPLEFEGTAPRLAVGHDISGGEIVQQLLPDSNVVKTLNIISYTHMSQPEYYEGMPCMFYCGNNPSAKEEVAKILRALGWKDTTDLGDITKSRLLEPMCLLWVTYGMAHNTWDHAFAMLKR